MTEYIILSEPELIPLLKVDDPYAYQEVANRQFRPLMACVYSHVQESPEIYIRENLLQISLGKSVFKRHFALKPKIPI